MCKCRLLGLTLIPTDSVFHCETHLILGQVILRAHLDSCVEGTLMSLLGGHLVHESAFVFKLKTLA